MLEITSKLNHRSYSEYYKIAEAALKTIEKLREYANHSNEAFKDPDRNRPDTKFIFFSKTQLLIICFDYTFSAAENFIEHIGFILFSDWCSKKNQKYYPQKLEKLKTARAFLQDQSKNLWVELLEEFTSYFKNQAGIRNSIKHSHSSKHDGKILTRGAQKTEDAISHLNDLNASTPLGIKEESCKRQLERICSLIEKTHKILSEKSILPQEGPDDLKNCIRRDLWDTFLHCPFAPTMYAQSGEYNTNIDLL